jgi:hypothetical protein
MIRTPGIFDQPDTTGEMHEGDSEDYSLWQQLYQHLLELAPLGQTLFDAVSSPNLDLRTERREISTCLASLRPVRKLAVQAAQFTFMDDTDVLFDVVTHLRKHA